MVARFSPPRRATPVTRAPGVRGTLRRARRCRVGAALRLPRGTAGKNREERPSPDRSPRGPPQSLKDWGKRRRDKQGRSRPWAQGGGLVQGVNECSQDKDGAVRLRATSNGGGRVGAPGGRRPKPRGLRSGHTQEARGGWRVGSRDKTGSIQ